MPKITLDTETAENAKPQSIVKEIIAKNSQSANAKVDEFKEEIEIEDESGNAKDPESVEDSTITQELLDEVGISHKKDFIGKPLSQIGKAYQESLAWANNTNQKVIKLEEELNSLKGQLSKQDEVKIQKQTDLEVRNRLGKAPDPTIDPDAFDEWLQKRDEILLDKMVKQFNPIKEELLNSFQNDPRLKKSEELAAIENERLILSSLQNEIGDKLKAQDVINAWFEDNKEDYDGFVKSGYYKNRPEKFVHDVNTWLKAQSYDSLKNQKESDLTKKIHNQTKKNLENISKSALMENKNGRSQLSNENNTETITGKIVAKLQKQAYRI